MKNLHVQTNMHIRKACVHAFIHRHIHACMYIYVLPNTYEHELTCEHIHLSQMHRHMHKSLHEITIWSSLKANLVERQAKRVGVLLSLPQPRPPLDLHVALCVDPPLVHALTVPDARLLKTRGDLEGECLVGNKKTLHSCMPNMSSEPYHCTPYLHECVTSGMSPTEDYDDW